MYFYKMAQAYRLLPHYTYADYLHWEGQWELIEGIPHAMSPAPGMRHQDVSGNLFSIFKDALSRQECNCKVFLPIDYRVNEDTVLQPDLLIVLNPVMGKFISEPPALVVEILSPSTALKDRNNKLHIYETQKIPYYLIVDPDKNIVEVYSLNDEGEYALAPLLNTYTFDLPGHCSIELDVARIW